MMFTVSARRRALVFVAVSLAVLVPWTGGARAGMKGQPQPPADAVAKIRAATAEIASSQKNVDQAMLEKIRAAGN